ncbi:MAG: hypothetical protein IIU80_06025 [Clostridia bacterium]|nr:hypothetical protein [Clostridia bacterium]
MKKIISLILSVVMIFTIGSVAFSVDAFAEETTAPENSITSQIPEEVMELAPIFTGSLMQTLGYLNFSNFRLPTSSDDFVDMLLKFLYGIVDVLIDVILKAINLVVPSIDFADKDTYVNDQFYPGMEDYLAEPADGAAWSIGYGSGSIQTGDELDGKHYVGGSLSFPAAKTVSAVYDDQRVRCVALDDGSGRGKIIIAVIDGFGISNTDVAGIRAQLADFAEANDIVGINISALHQHSCVDTFGMNGDLIKMVFTNPAANIANRLFGADFELLDGRNKAFMENLYNVTEDAIKAAVNTMEEGKLYYSTTDVEDLVREKRDPYVIDADLHKFRFVPADGGRETWIVNSPIHCVGNGAAGTEVTGDYPYYMEQVIDEREDANLMVVLGAELAISSDYQPLNLPEDYDSIEGINAYGTELATRLIEKATAEVEVAPLLNFKMTQYSVPVTNQILLFAGKLGAISNTVVSTDDLDFNAEIYTEIGYLELGTDLAVALVPGELEAAIAYGGCLQGADSWTGKDFDYPSMQEVVGTDKKLLVFGLMNDQVGYILPDNEFKSLLAGENEEIVASGSKAGSATITAFMELVESIGR